MTPNKAIDTEGTDEIVCPWCFHRDSDSGASGACEGWQDDECGACGKPFRFCHDVRVTYDTEPIT